MIELSDGEREALWRARREWEERIRIDREERERIERERIEREDAEERARQMTVESLSVSGTLDVEERERNAVVLRRDKPRGEEEGNRVDEERRDKPPDEPREGETCGQGVTEPCVLAAPGPSDAECHPQLGGEVPPGQI